MLSERNFARQIDLTSLQLFVAVCELGSIGRAAEREFIAASAVSKRLSDLEATLGTQLLYRHARGVRLTPAGESLLHHARSMMFSLEKMQAELSEYADGVRGHVRMHASISAIVQFLPEDLGAFARAHPQVKIDLEEHLSAEVLRAVQEGAADIGISVDTAVDVAKDAADFILLRKDLGILRLGIDEGRRTFVESEYRVSKEADRMGIRFEGPTIAHAKKVIFAGAAVQQLRVKRRLFSADNLKETCPEKPPNAD